MGARMSAAVRISEDITRRLRAVAVMGAIEATTYLVLVVATVWKALDGPDLQRPIGFAHGIAFLVYAGTVLRARPLAGWDSRTTLSLLLASVLPGGAPPGNGMKHLPFYHMPWLSVRRAAAATAGPAGCPTRSASW